MAKSRDILKKKAEEAESLKKTVTSENPTNPEAVDLKPQVIYDEQGKKIMVFNDPLHTREKRSVVNYSIFNGKWEFENIDDLDEHDKEKCAIKFMPVSDGVSLTIAFKSLKDRVEFMSAVYNDKEMKQRGGGINLENLANSKVIKTTGGIIGLSLLGYGLYRLLGKDKD